jgi:hypothetical protein
LEVTLTGYIYHPSEPKLLLDKISIHRYKTYIGWYFALHFPCKEEATILTLRNKTTGTSVEQSPDDPYH